MVGLFFLAVSIGLISPPGPAGSRRGRAARDRVGDGRTTWQRAGVTARARGDGGRPCLIDSPLTTLPCPDTRRPPSSILLPWWRRPNGDAGNNATGGGASVSRRTAFPPPQSSPHGGGGQTPTRANNATGGGASVSRHTASPLLNPPPTVEEAGRGTLGAACSRCSSRNSLTVRAIAPLVILQR